MSEEPWTQGWGWTHRGPHSTLFHTVFPGRCFPLGWTRGSLLWAGRTGRALGLTTHFSQTTDMRSSTPLVPSGMRVKLSLPTAFWAVVKVQWALPVTWRSPLRTSGSGEPRGARPS